MGQSWFDTKCPVSQWTQIVHRMDSLSTCSMIWQCYNTWKSQVDQSKKAYCGQLVGSSSAQSSTIYSSHTVYIPKVFLSSCGSELIIPTATKLSPWARKSLPPHVCDPKTNNMRWVECLCMSPSLLGNCTIYSTWFIMICLVILILSLLFTSKWNLEREYRDCIKSRKDKIVITRHIMMHQVLYNVHVTLFIGQLHNI